jgi:hypothetical protein
MQEKNTYCCSSVAYLGGEVHFIFAVRRPPPRSGKFFFCSGWKGGQTSFNGSDVRPPPPPLAFGLPEKRPSNDMDLVKNTWSSTVWYGKFFFDILKEAEGVPGISCEIGYTAFFLNNHICEFFKETQ